MSKTPLRRNNSNSKKNNKLIIVSKGRLISAKQNINYITLQEGDLKLTMEVNNSSLNRDDINKAVNNIKSQNIHNSKSNTNIIKNEQDDSIIMKSTEKKYFKILYKQKEKNKLKIDQTKNDNFIETTGNIKDNSENKQNDKIEIKELKSNIPSNSNKDEIKSSINDDVIDDIIINDKIEDKIKNNEDDNNDNKLKIKILDIIDIDKNNENERNNKMRYNDNFVDENPLDSKEVFIEGKIGGRNEMKKKLSSQEMSMNNNEFEELKHIYIDSSRSKENTIPLNNNLVDKSNHRTKLQKIENLGSKSEASINKNQIKKGGSAIVNLGDSVKGNYAAQNLITEMEGDEVSNKDSEKMKNDLISDSKTIKVEENNEEESLEKENKKNINDDLDEKKTNENIIINKTKESLITLNNNNKNKNETNNDKNKNAKFRNLNFININPLTIYHMCLLCEKTFQRDRLFSAECEQHFLCRKCAKQFYEDTIENGNKELTCPLIKCRKPVDIIKLSEIISEEHYNIITNKIDRNQNYLLFAKLKTDTVPENVELYTEKHVLDIDTNKKFFNYNNMKETYCSNCNKYALFPKSNSHFFKCLYCESKKCKYCSKNFNKEHLELNNPSHCKVFYRLNDIESKKKICILKYLEELFFIIASFFLCFIGAFLLIKQIFYKVFNIKENKNFVKFFFLYFFTIICFLIVFPIIYIFYPVFPSIMALFGS